MLTAVLGGLLFAAIAGWLWQQLSIISLPTPTWVTTLAQPEGTPPAPGTVLTLQHAGGAGLESIGTAAVQPATVPEPGSLLLGNISLAEGRSMTEVDRLRVDDAGGQTLFSSGVAARRGIPVIEPVFVQAGVAGVVLLTGVVLLYYFVGLKKSSVEFLIATDAEMRKVNWSTRKHIVDSTWVVVGATVLLVISLFLMDVLFSRFMSLIGVLKN